MIIKTSSVRPASLALAGMLALCSASSGIVTNHPDAATPDDPHVVDGPVQVDDLVVNFPFNRPALDPDGIVELHIIRAPDAPDGTCTGALINTAQGPAVLTAAHCLSFGSLKQVRTDIKISGQPSTFETCHTEDDPGCDLDPFVSIHPQYGNNVLRGHDLALVFFDEPVPILGTTRYSVADADLPLDGWRSFLKFGYGCSGNGLLGVDETDPGNYDHQLRWTMNSWDSNSLGSYGVTVGGQSFTNWDTQLTYDFDNGTDVDHNLYNYYGNTFDPKTAETYAYYTCFGPCGIAGAEGGSCPGDSGGPNFIYDESTGRWVIRAVTSYALRMDDNWNGFHGNSDVDGPGPGAFGRNLSAGEFGGDALVTPADVSTLLSSPRVSTDSISKTERYQNSLGLGRAPTSSRSLKR